MPKSKKFVVDVENIEGLWRMIWDIPDRITADIEVMFPMVYAHIKKVTIPIAIVNGHKWRPEGNDVLRFVDNDFAPGHPLYPYRNTCVSEFFMERLADSVSTSVLASSILEPQTGDDPTNDLD
jgi:hypothetical protein